MPNIKGFRTFALGLATALAPSALTYIAGYDWTQTVGPNAAMVIAGMVTIGARFFTTTAPGKST
jgi:hypothetical protein